MEIPDKKVMALSTDKENMLKPDGEDDFSSIYFTNWFYIALLSIVFTFIMAFQFPFLMVIAQGGIFLMIAIMVLELIILFGPKKTLDAERKVNNTISMGDENIVEKSENNYGWVRVGDGYKTEQ